MFSVKKLLLLSFIIVFISCQNFGKLKVITKVPKKLKEVSGLEISSDKDFFWMLNDGGNKPILYGVSSKGKIKKQLKINAKNNDWEDLTSDDLGNIYIADFGNNRSKRQNLVILKIRNQDLNKEKIEVERIRFSYPEQTKFPPKKKKLFFDSESIFYWKNHLYIFTKSRVKHQFGKTSLYKIPAKAGNYEAKFISEFNNCNNLECWITSADISENGKRIALLTHQELLIFSNFKDDNFFSGTLERFPFNHISQKESVVFKNKNTLYITDEKSHGTGGNLYEFKLN